MMKVTHTTIKLCKEINKDTKYIIYFPGNCEDVDKHTEADWGWCDKNTVVDLCNYPYHSEWHNPSVLGYSKLRYAIYNITALIAFTSVIATLYLFASPALAILASIALSIGLLATMLFINSTPIRSNVKFYTRGEDSVAVGIKRVLDLLEKGVHPDDIILRGFSIGGGVTAEVYKKFKSEGIHLRCQILNSFSSIKDVLIGKESRLGKLIAPLLKIVHWNMETYKTIDSITPYTMFFNSENDQVMKGAQLAVKVRDTEKEKSNQTTDKIFELLFKKHTVLEPNDIGKSQLEDYGNNTHSFPMSWLRSKESYNIDAEGLQYLFTYLPYHVDVLRSEVENSSVEKKEYTNQKKQLSSILRKVLEGSADEVKELQTLLSKLSQDKCLDKNSGYRKENFEEKFRKLNKWIEKHNISFVDLDDYLDDSSYCAKDDTLFLRENIRISKLVRFLQREIHITNLTSLDLRDNNIGDEGAKELANGNLTNLTSLDLSFNRIGDKGAKELANGNLTNLTSLDLTGNNIGDEGAKELANGNLTNLTSLGLSLNRIGNKGAKELTNGNLTNLTSLDLRVNNIGSEGVKALLKSDNFPNLKSLSLNLLSKVYIGSKVDILQRIESVLKPSDKLDKPNLEVVTQQAPEKVC
ncbi:leucine-rich repeat domain-containing protein [Wolbachia endosymbiont (group A) of Agelastica alni]|uniref:leucine-rich repeat domain-containing protein n=1 Tax=Wolbachia endosymbiont (group A) of Agelastica alni TaxID=3066130 RepID=UPI003340391C